MRLIPVRDPGRLRALGERVLETLKNTQVPGFDVDVLTSGVVQKFRISTDGKKIAIFVDFSGSDPSCNFCRMINYGLWTKIISLIRERIRKLGFEEVRILDLLTGLDLVLPAV